MVDLKIHVKTKRTSNLQDENNQELHLKVLEVLTNKSCVQLCINNELTFVEILYNHFPFFTGRNTETGEIVHFMDIHVHQIPLEFSDEKEIIQKYFI